MEFLVSLVAAFCAAVQLILYVGFKRLSAPCTLTGVEGTLLFLWLDVTPAFRILALGAAEFFPKCIGLPEGFTSILTIVELPTSAIILS